jgi:hypothetical protein
VAADETAGVFVLSMDELVVASERLDRGAGRMTMRTAPPRVARHCLR